MSTEAELAALKADVKHLRDGHADLRQVVAQVSLQAEERIQRHEDGCEKFREETRKDIKQINKTIAGWSGGVMVIMAIVQLLIAYFT